MEIFTSYQTEILHIAEQDQLMRQEYLSGERTSLDEEMDKKHTQRLKEIIVEIGWPTISKVGETASHKAWLIVQHAGHDLDFQKHCLLLMKENEDDISKKDIAYLEDRVRIAEGRPMLYGTQVSRDPNTGELVVGEIEDAEHVDERRLALGLDTLKEYHDFVRRQYAKHVTI